MAEKELKIIVDSNGKLEIDLLGWKGKGCDHAIDDLLDSLGGKVEVKKKKEWYAKTTKKKTKKNITKKKK